jgi:hypothetical protein
VKQGEFDALSGSEAIRFSGGQFRFAILSDMRGFPNKVTPVLFGSRTDWIDRD